MNIDINGLIIRRAIMHTVFRKEDLQDYSATEHSSEIQQLSDPIIRVIKDRLINATGKASKAFQLTISNTGADSFYNHCHGLAEEDDNTFIEASQNIVDLLGESQTKSSYPGGYLLFIASESEGLPVYIVIKAEPHEALIVPPGAVQISLLEKVFLSPTQKLFKIGILSKIAEDDALAANDLYEAFLFDDQFRAYTKPAAYFYDDFLGFSIDENAKIQSQSFFDKTEEFIMEHIPDMEAKTELLNILRSEFNVNQNASVSPAEFADTYFSPALAGTYKEDVAYQLPPNILKDPILFKNKLSKRKVKFPGEITVTGPNEGFDNKVKILAAAQIIDHPELVEPGYTYLKIIGTAYANE